MRPLAAKEVWTSAIGGRDAPPRDDHSIVGLQARLASIQPQFTALVRRIRDRNEWDDAFRRAVRAAGELRVRQRGRAHSDRLRFAARRERMIAARG